MRTTRGLRQRPANHDTVLLQGRVSTLTRQEFRDAAIASGITLSYYIDLLAQDHRERNGGLPVFEVPQRREEAAKTAT